MSKILFIEDEKKFAEPVASYLRKKGFLVVNAYSGREAQEELKKNLFDLIILDLGLPDKKGINLCLKIRKKKTVPILILTARDSVSEKVVCLDAGADDYLVKPASLEELAARINRLLTRRTEASFRSAIFQFKGIRFDTTNGRLTAGNRSVKLTQKEKAVLEYLLLKRGQVLPQMVILDHVWGNDINPFSNVVNVVISSLRKKLQHLSGQNFIDSVHGLGYKFKHE